MEGGIYIGYFYRDIFIQGKLIFKEKNDLCIFPIKNKKYHGLCIRKNPSYIIKKNIYEDNLNGIYSYRNFKDNTTIDSFFYDNQLEGYSFRKFTDHYEILKYKGGIIKGKSLYHIYLIKRINYISQKKI